MVDAIYLDYNATSPLSPSVINYIKEGMIRDWANPSSEHDAGYEKAIEIRKSRSRIADFLGCSTSQITFTSGATESINTVLSADTLASLGVKTVITSPMEHHATLDRAKYLETKGFHIKMVRTLPTGSLDYDHLDHLASFSKKAIISLLYTNNETGIINDVKKISSISQRHGCLVHIDAVQALGKIKFSLNELEVDFASFSGHKIGSLKGIGMLYRKQHEIVPLMHGGGQEKALRPGTYNLPGIKSIEMAISDIDFDAIEKRGYEARFAIEQLFKQIFPSAIVNGAECDRVYNTISLAIPEHSSKAIMLGMSRSGIYISTGSACSSGIEVGSHVLKEFTEFEKNSIRISFSISMLDPSVIHTISMKLNDYKVKSI